jgi:hypothetical protein
MRDLIDVKGDRLYTSVRAKLWSVSWGSVLLAALAAHASAGPVGMCINSIAYGNNGNITSVQYATVAGGGCNPGYSSSIGLGGSVAPAFIPPGQTIASLEADQPSTSGVSDAYSYASLDAGLLRDRSLSAVRADSLSFIEDNVHFAINNGAGSATFQFNAHLSGSLGVLGFNSIQDQFSLGGSGCWDSQNGSFGPCGSGNFGWITSSFTNLTAHGFDFTGTFSVTNGQVLPFSADLQAVCSQGAQCDFSNTALFSLTLPSNLTFTSDSGVLFTQPPGGATTPEPGTFGVIAVGLLTVGVLRRRRCVGRTPGPQTGPRHQRT